MVCRECVELIRSICGVYVCCTGGFHTRCCVSLMRMKSDRLIPVPLLSFLASLPSFLFFPFSLLPSLPSPFLPSLFFLSPSLLPLHSLPPLPPFLLPSSFPSSLTLSLSLPSSPSLPPPPPLPLLHSVPSFIVRLYKTKIFTSKVYDHLRKTDALAELLLPTPVPICGDIKVEFYHNSRFGGKVRLCFMTAASCQEFTV